MNTMSEPRPCPQCGAPIPAGAAEGLCPRCLLALNLATQTRLAGETQPPAGSPAVPPLPLEDVAKLFPQLEIIRLVGTGGMGAVYQARQPALDRHVALKLLHTPPANDPGFAERFAQEARALAKLTHPNIVGLHEFGQAGGRPYFLMEFVDGVNLRQLQQAGRLSPREALSIVPQVCDALQYAHDEGIVHRDIKPENVLIDRKGRVKVADFGLAKLMGREAGSSRLTGAGHVMGTPHYMAPEQVEHPLEVDHRADIFSLGVVFYELLTGELPLGRFAMPSKKVQIDVRLDEVVLRALEKEPAMRYGQASELKTQVETIVRDAGKPEAAPSVASIAPDQPQPQERSRCSWMAIVGAGLALLAFGLGVIGPAIAGPMVLSERLMLWNGAIQLFCLLAAWGSLVLGWAAVAQIRRSAGRLHGLGLAVFDGLVFPLVVLDVGIVYALSTVGKRAFDGSHGEGITLLVAGVLSLAIDFFVVRRVWRKVNANLKRSFSETPVSSAGKGGNLLSTLAYYFACLSAFIPSVFYWLAPGLAPWLSPDGQQFMLWLTLAMALLAVSLGSITWQTPRGRRAMLMGGISLTIWVLFFVAGLFSKDLIRQGAEQEHQRQVDGWPLDPKLVVESSHRANERPRFHIEWRASSWRVKNFAAVETKDRFFLRINGVDYPLRTPHEPYAVRQFDLDPVEEGVPVMWLPGKYRAAYVLKKSDYVSPLFPQTMFSGVEKASNEVEFEIPPLSDEKSAETTTYARADSRGRQEAGIPVDVKNALVFGPVVECVVKGALDLETGRTAALPVAIEKLDDLMETILEAGAWMVHEGLDVFADTGAGFSGFGMRAIAQDNARWDTLTAAQVGAALGAETAKPPIYVKLTAGVYVVETREGGKGILQIMGPAGDGVRIRYKLLYGADAASRDASMAAQAWLALMDEGRYAESWDAAAESFHQAVTRTGWAAEVEKIRRPLGGMTSRRSTVMQQAKTFPGMPDGDYWMAEFDSSFTGLASAAETVTFAKGKDGRWRAIGYLIRPRTEEQQLTVTTARDWLLSIDEGRYAGSWTTAAGAFRDALTQEKWVAALEGVRRPLGDRVFRTADTCRTTTSLPGEPAGRYVVMQFNASFTGEKSAVETVTFMQEKDGQWRAAGYFIK